MSDSTWGLRRVERDPLAFLRGLAESDRDVVPCTIGRRHGFFLNHPRVIEDVLVRNAEGFVKGRGYMRASRLLGRGLLVAADSAHPAQRRLLQPAFHRRRIAAYARTVVEHACRTVECWKAGVPIDMSAEMQRLTLTIVGDTLFGVDLSAHAAEVREAVAMATPRSMDALLAVVAPPSHVRRARHCLEAIVDEIIARRLAFGEERDDVLELLLTDSGYRNRPSVDASDRTAMELVRDQAITFLLAGHDTISHALTWTSSLMSELPHVDRHVHMEVTAVAPDRPVSADDLPHLTYTRSTLAEALRLLPPAWVIVRRASKPLLCGDTLIPEGALVFASPFITHRDARFFPEPLVFDPDRWRAADTARPKCAYFPFGAGSRACIGEGFAWMEGTLILACLAQRWTLTRTETTPIAMKPAITLRPEGPVMMLPHRRPVSSGGFSVERLRESEHASTNPAGHQLKD
jgi:cytochrome P450